MTSSIWGLLYLCIIGSAGISGIKVGMGGFLIVIFILALGFFFLIPAILHVNYWRFDKDTVLTISDQGFTLRNKLTTKTFNASKDEIEKIFCVECPPVNIPWGHEYAVIKLKDGKTVKISNYIIDPGEIPEILRVKDIIRREIYIPTIQPGKDDLELRSN